MLAALRPDGGRDLPDQPLRHGVRAPPIGSRSPRRGVAGRGRGLRPGLAHRDARAVLGHPRLDAGVAHLARPARQAWRRRWSRRTAAASTTSRRRAAFVERELDFALSHTFGGHTSCVELETGGDEYFVCDMGSGARPFGAHVLARQSGRPATVNIFMSHMHWDHIMGFPFFGPAYVPGTQLRIYGCHATLEHALPPAAGRRRRFPVPFAQLARDASNSCTLEPGETHEVAGVKVTPQLQLHSRRLVRLSASSASGKSVVYTHRLGAQARRHPPRPQRIRRVLPRRRSRHLRRHVFARRGDLGEGGLGPFEQHRGRRALPDGAARRSSCFSITSRRTTIARSTASSGTRAGWRSSRARGAASR